MIQKNYTQAIKTIKQAILKSRYQAALLANREMLMLYFSVGEYISKNSREGKWGTNAIEVISTQLQKELPGLRGFSTTNLRNMRLFYEAWQHVIPDSQIHQLPTDEIHQMPSDELQISDIHGNSNDVLNRQMPSDDLSISDNEFFVEEIIIRQMASDNLGVNVAFVNRQLSTDEFATIQVLNFGCNSTQCYQVNTNCKTLFPPYSNNKTTLVEIGLTPP